MTTQTHTPTGHRILSQEELTEAWVALSNLRQYGSAVTRAKAVLALDAAALAEAKTPMAAEYAAECMSIHSQELLHASKMARDTARPLYLVVPDYLRQDVADTRDGAFGERISSWLATQEGILDSLTD